MAFLLDFLKETGIFLYCTQALHHINSLHDTQFSYKQSFILEMDGKTAKPRQKQS